MPILQTHPADDLEVILSGENGGGAIGRKGMEGGGL